MALNKTIFVILLFVVSYKLTNAIECYSCDSAQNTECATTPGQQLEVEECATENDECVTTIAAGYTRRGCFSRLFPSKYCDANTCERCTRSLCNGNIYPENRLQCYQCIDCNEVEKTHKLLTCPIYKENDRCYTNINKQLLVQRGCVATDMPATCPDVCLKCNYSGCNNEKAVVEQTCISCEHSQNRPNAACMRGSVMESPCKLNSSDTSLKRCSTKIVNGNRAQCFTHTDASGSVTRGCADKMNFYSNGKTELCDGNDCNSECTNIGCLSCGSDNITENEQQRYYCQKGINLVWQKCDNDVFDCYACEHGNTIRRGCAADNYQNLDSSSTSSPEICYKCRDLDGCNKSPVRTCYACNSLDDANCELLEDSSKTAKERCSIADELCVSTLVQTLKLAYVIRGCASSLPECSTNDIFCTRCNASLCNNPPIPVTMRQFSDNQKSIKLDLNSSSSAARSHNIIWSLISLILFLCYEDVLLCLSFMLDCGFTDIFLN